MRQFRILTLALGALLLLPLHTWAQQRTFVSGSGNDGNPCTRDFPCRTIPAGISAVAAGGEVVVLDSADYSLSSALTISKSVSVIAPPGVYAGISMPSNVTVQAGSSDIVVLRGLTFLAASAGPLIQLGSGTTLHVENCNFKGVGILHTGNGQLFVKDTSVTGVGGSALSITGAFGPVPRASLNRVRLEGNGTGLLVSGTNKVAIGESVVSGNSTGISSAGGQLAIEECLIANNSSNGILVQGGTVRVSNSTVAGNGVGLLQQFGGTLLSRVNNTIEGNTTDISGTVGTYNPR